MAEALRLDEAFAILTETGRSAAPLLRVAWAASIIQHAVSFCPSRPAPAWPGSAFGGHARQLPQQGSGLTRLTGGGPDHQVQGVVQEEAFVQAHLGLPDRIAPTAAAFDEEKDAMLIKPSADILHDRR